MTTQAEKDEHLRSQFRALWDSINGKTAPWSANPWCWVYTFRRVEGDH